MCGIVGYIGNGDTSDVLLDSLGRLEYRGYDSAGIALVCEGELKVIKSFGRIHFLQEKMPKLIASVGIGHTRWATHGKPSEINAHPHQDCTGRIAVVHNGIIENYKELKDMLISKGHSFASETDTEVVAHLLEENCAGSTLRALQDTIKQLQGSFAFAIINQDEPDLIFAAKKESPLVIGIGEGQYFLASDVTAFLKYTKNAVFLEDGDIAVLSKAGIKIMDFEGYPVSREVQTIDWDLDSAEKAGYEHFMLKEIHEQPQSLKACIAGRLNELTGDVTLNELTLNEAAIHDLKRIIIIACGTSYHAGMLGKYAIEALTEIPVSIEIGSEIRYSSVHMDSRTLIIAVSQSGETADTHAAVKDALKKGAHVVAITNVVGSSISRVATDTIYTMAGPEIGVAATKTFTAQVVAMYMLAIYLGRKAGTLSPDRSSALITALKTLPQKAQQVL
ncbi:MAG TPA: glutamine--fructose-6-phosphate transaminase (isomerizing), partial [Methanocellaceae archaeon]